MNDEICDITIHHRDDVSQSRQTTRLFLQDLGMGIKDQARISWIVDYLGRQILLWNQPSCIHLEKIINDHGRLGTKIECRGGWLHPFGPLYQAHLVPIFSRYDCVKYTDHPPHLVIMAWAEITHPEGEYHDPENSAY